MLIQNTWTSDATPAVFRLFLPCLAFARYVFTQPGPEADVRFGAILDPTRSFNHSVPQFVFERYRTKWKRSHRRDACQFSRIAQDD